MRHLVLHDVDGIQSYIFATNRLQEIRGASSLIDHLNRELTRECAGDKDSLIYSNGGSAAADFSDEDQARKFCWEVAALYRDQTHTTSSTGVVQEYNDTVKGGFGAGLAKAQQRLRQAKESSSWATQLLSSPFFKRCQSCAAAPAVTQTSNEPVEAVCQSCATKRAYPRQPRIHREIRQGLAEIDPKPFRFPRELDEIALMASPRSYLGVIYADGNRIGDLLLRLQDPDALRRFSEMVDNAVTASVVDAVKNRFAGIFLQRSVEGIIGDQPVLPLVAPLCGGDDLVLITRGEDAYGLALDYLAQFESQVRSALDHPDLQSVKEMIDKDWLSACAGVVIAKGHTPLSDLMALATDLCHSAKRRSYQELQADPAGPEVSCIDFQVITTPRWGNLGSVRSGPEYVLREDTTLTARPYTLQEGRELQQAVGELKEVNFPNGKLHDLYRSLRTGIAQAQLDYLTMYLRARQSEDMNQKKALSRVEKLLAATPTEAPWEVRGVADRTTRYGDLTEIYSFVPA
ncbi:MAG: hypothetical protein ACE5Q6_13920 [Dehalococcoidia bacterium]